MRLKPTIIPHLFIIALLCTSSAIAQGISFKQQVVDDYDNFYNWQRFTRIGIGFAFGGIMANSSFDQNIRDDYQRETRSNNTNDMAKIAKKFGETKYILPLSLAAAGLGYYQSDSNIGQWGLNASRAYLVGIPSLLVSQRLTGGSRPGETRHQSDWKPFNDANGVSGHAFMGAVPFMTIARMNEQTPAIKYLAYALSTATAWSRINDDAHYFSQAALGWYLAYESVDAVFDSNNNNQLRIAPMMIEDGYGITMNMQW